MIRGGGRRAGRGGGAGELAAVVAWVGVVVAAANGGEGRGCGDGGARGFGDSVNRFGEIITNSPTRFRLVSVSPSTILGKQ